MTPEELLAAFEAFLARMDVLPKDVPGILGGKLATCKCGGVSCADVVACVKSGLQLEARECPAIVSWALFDSVGNVFESAGDVSVSVEADGSFTFTGVGVRAWSLLPPMECDGVLRYIVQGLGTKEIFATPEAECL